MNIEKDLFKRSIVCFSKLIDYGFIKSKSIYIYEKEFLNNSFKAIILINKNGIITGKVIDLDSNEEYVGFRMTTIGEFSSKVKEEYLKILRDIKMHCFEEKYFVSDQANRITKYLNDKYQSVPEFLWKDYKDGVFRNLNNNKWYGIIMNIDLSKIDDGTGEIEIINVKLERNRIIDLLKRKGFYQAYHMNKKDWITIILNDTLDDEVIEKLIDESYQLIDKG